MPLGRITVTCSPDESVTVAAEMPFLGTYSGKPLQRITLAETITLDHAA